MRVCVVNGDVAQMVERSLSMREVQGSIRCFSGVCSIVVSTSPCGGEIPGSNPGTRTLMLGTLIYTHTSANQQLRIPATLLRF